MISAYLAARFDRKEEMKELSLEIEKVGVHITSRWLDEDKAPADERKLEEFLCATAKMDMDDVIAADMLIRFSDDLHTVKVPSKWVTASRFEETGAAQVLGKDIIVVGGKQSLFDHFKNRVHLKDKAALLKYLEQRVSKESQEE